MNKADAFGRGLQWGDSQMEQPHHPQAGLELTPVFLLSRETFIVP